MIPMESVGIFERVTSMKEQIFDFTAMMNHERKVPIIVKEKNKPNLDRMASAFFHLLRK
jgi:hypothetical protein